MNLIEAKTKKEKNYIKIEIKLEDGSIASLKETKNLNLPKDIIVGVRPENITKMEVKLVLIINIYHRK